MTYILVDKTEILQYHFVATDLEQIKFEFVKRVSKIANILKTYGFHDMQDICDKFAVYKTKKRFSNSDDFVIVDVMKYDIEKKMFVSVQSDECFSFYFDDTPTKNIETQPENDNELFGIKFNTDPWMRARSQNKPNKISFSDYELSECDIPSDIDLNSDDYFNCCSDTSSEKPCDPPADELVREKEECEKLIRQADDIKKNGTPEEYQNIMKQIELRINHVSELSDERLAKITETKKRIAKDKETVANKLCEIKHIRNVEKFNETREKDRKTKFISDANTYKQFRDDILKGANNEKNIPSFFSHVYNVMKNLDGCGKLNCDDVSLCYDDFIKMYTEYIVNKKDVVLPEDDPYGVLVQLLRENV